MSKQVMDEKKEKPYLATAFHHPLLDYGTHRRIESEKEEKELLASDPRWRKEIYSEAEIEEARLAEKNKKRSK